MEKEELDKILENHRHYLNRDIDGWVKMRADLRNADLGGVNLSGADLREANLRGADLNQANLNDANLEGAIMERANLEHANLHYANLKDVNLSDAFLRRASLQYADLRRADLLGTNLLRAELYCTDLRGANMERTNFEYSNLHCAELDEKERFRNGVILTESIIGWKKCISDSRKPSIVKLEIPKWSVVFCINGKKCRTNRAKVLSLSDGNLAFSVFNNGFTYEVGKEIVIDDFDMAYNVECASGIHFFKTREEAENY